MANPDLFDFEWATDSAGYELVDVPAVSGRTLLENSPARVRIVRNGGDLMHYRPLADEPGLFRRFAETCDSPMSILLFTSNFGPLTSFDRDLDHVETTLDHAFRMRSIIDALDAMDHRRAADIFNASVSVRFEGRIDSPERGRPRFQITPPNLIAALWFQLAGEITDGTAFRRCRNCPTWFPYGAGVKGTTARRQFCSDRCRVQWNRQKKELPQ